MNNNSAIWINCGTEQFYIILGAFSACAGSSPSSDSTVCHNLTLMFLGRLATRFQVTPLLITNQSPGVGEGNTTILAWSRLSPMDLHVLGSVTYCCKTFATDPAFVGFPFWLMLFLMYLQHI